MPKKLKQTSDINKLLLFNKVKALMKQYRNDAYENAQSDNGFEIKERDKDYASKLDEVIRNYGFRK